MLAAAAAAFVLVGNGDGPAGPRELTSDEAGRLALARFRNYDAGGRAVTITVPGTAGGLVVTGSVDYRTKTGYGVVHGSGRDASSDGLIQWTAATVLVRPMSDAPAAAPATPPASGWSARPLQASGSALDTSLAMALGLGSDRPENAMLLGQNGARWIEHAKLRGHETDVMTGPDAQGRTGTSDTVRYWIDPDGTMFRVRAAVASEPKPVVIDFDTQDYLPVQPLPGLAAGR
ncbi:hypothetical protein ACIQF6_18535 [Kitasatospora sp. NPDC092948]|uniref:hypothetical protein n=1 Tax=Kitasatospora sp. NPDC092948 TaxID=3364088 RepID=UPI003825585C